MIEESVYADQIVERALKIQGWFTESEIRLMIRTLRTQACFTPSSVPLTWLEIGAAYGRSTTVMCMCAEQANKDIRVISIDPHEGSLTYPGGINENGRKFPRTQLDQVQSTFSDYLTNVFSFVQAGILDYRIAKSQDIATENISAKYLDAIFIDGLHDYESVKADYHQFKPKYHKGHTLVMFHDTDWQGPYELASELIASGELIPISKSDSLGVCLYA